MGLKPVVLSDGWSWASAKGRAALPRFSLKGVGPPQLFPFTTATFLAGGDLYDSELGLYSSLDAAQFSRCWHFVLSLE